MVSKGPLHLWIEAASRKGNVSSSAFRSLLCRWLNSGASALNRHYTLTIINSDTILHEQLCERTTNLSTACDIH